MIVDVGMPGCKCGSFSKRQTSPVCVSWLPNVNLISEKRDEKVGVFVHERRRISGSFFGQPNPYIARQHLSTSWSYRLRITTYHQWDAHPHSEFRHFLHRPVRIPGPQNSRKKKKIGGRGPPGFHLLVLRLVVRRVDLLRVVLLVVLRTRPLVALRADLLLRVVLLAPLAFFLAAILMPPSC